MLINRNNTRQKDTKTSIWTQVWHCVLFAVLPAAMFYLMESYDRNPFAQIRPMAHCFNILLFELIAWSLWLLFKNSAWALSITGLLSLAAGLTNHYVMAFRSTPFVPWDIFSVKTAASVASEYDFTPSVRVVIVSLGLFLLILFSLCFRMRFPGRLLLRIPLAAALILILVLFAGRLQDESFQTSHSLYPYLFTPSVMVKYNGFAVTFTMDLAYLKVEKPSGYQKEEAQAILSACEDASSETAEEEFPNLIVIMDEAFSDLSVLGDFATNEDYMPFVHSLQDGAENTITGTLNVSVCGGNTANTEFEFLTGNTMAFLPSGSIPYQQYLNAETDSLALWLKSLGYATYAQHPYNASGWERDQVYPLLGFDDLTFLPDYTPKDKVRSYVSDKRDFEMIISTFENKEEGKPAFIFNVTMQNHGGYTDTYEDFTNTITAEELDNSALDQYLSLLSLTDRDLESLIEYFSNVEEKTMIVFFGDHQPSNTVARSIQKANGTDPDNLTEEENELRYQVPFVIWANFDIEEGQGESTSANYLAIRALRAAGIPLSSYQTFLEQVEEFYPCISAVRMEETADDEQKAKALLLLDEYKKLEYYQLFDRDE